MQKIVVGTFVGAISLLVLCHELHPYVSSPRSSQTESTEENVDKWFELKKIKNVIGGLSLVENFSKVFSSKLTNISSPVQTNVVVLSQTHPRDIGVHKVTTSAERKQLQKGPPSFSFRPGFGKYLRFRDQPDDQDVLGGTDPFWLQEAKQANSEREQMLALETLREAAKTILVGSGTSVLATRSGSAIDRFPVIFRYNRFQISGYEDYVGTRTTHWVVNNIDIRNRKKLTPLKMVGRISRVIVYVPSPRSRKKVQASIKSMKGIKKKLEIRMFSDRDTKLWKGKVNFTGSYFSTGLVTIFQNLRRPPVVIHGFDFGKGSHEHYFQTKGEDTCHDITGEGFLLQQMERDGLVVRLPCLEASTVEEMNDRCRVSTIVPPAYKYSNGCKKDKSGRRVDVPKGQRIRNVNEAALGMSGLPKPFLNPKRGAL
mmetsp:Transcript_40480/g.96212  ORF Transcript_40480/g.96212 Transcript_40480/m.96212 type:complete len:427 (+) Transcript_40480:43-1323(+)